MASLPAQFFKDAPLFASLSEDEAARLGQVMAEIDLGPGQILFLEGEAGDQFFVVVEGQVQIVKALGTEEERVLALKTAGDYFGEMSLLDPAGKRTATVRTVTAARLLALTRDEFLQLLHKQPGLAYEMVRILSLQLRDSNNATIAELRSKNRDLSVAYAELRRKNQDLSVAYAELKAAQVQIIEKEKLEQELRTARRIQQSILPGELPRVAGYDFGAVMKPARSVGGDLYDFIPLGGGRMGIAVGDVSDKGVPAAIFMALTRSLLRAEATRSPSRTPSPRQALERVNSLLLDMNQEGMFVTMLYGILDPRLGTFAYARAGHELPLLITAHEHGGSGWKGEPGRQAFDVSLAEHGEGVPLGLFDRAPLDEKVIQLSPGDTLLLYTDGATDITDTAEVLYGMERLQETACLAAHLPRAQAFCDEIWRRLAEYCRGAVQADDVALVSIRST